MCLCKEYADLTDQTFLHLKCEVNTCKTDECRLGNSSENGWESEV